MNKQIMRFSFAAPGHHLLRTLLRKKLLVLGWHGFRRDADMATAGFFRDAFTTSWTFEHQLRHLRTYYYPVSLHDALLAWSRGLSLPDNAALVTIDAGYHATYEIAFPLLRQYAVPAVVFLATGFLDRERPRWGDRVRYAVWQTQARALEYDTGAVTVRYRLRGPAERLRCLGHLQALVTSEPQESRDEVVDGIELQLGVRLAFGRDMPDIFSPLSWDEVRMMEQSGLVAFGARTVHDAVLSRSQPETARQEIIGSQERIAQETGKPCVFFSYPQGEPGSFDKRHVAILRERGFRSALTTISGVNDARTDPFALKRVSMDNEACAS